MKESHESVANGAMDVLRKTLEQLRDLHAFGGPLWEFTQLAIESSHRSMTALDENQKGVPTAKSRCEDPVLYHEAGHAVIAVLCGRSIRELRVVPEPEHHYRTYVRVDEGAFRWPRQPSGLSPRAAPTVSTTFQRYCRQRIILEQQIMIAMAGTLAEYLFCRRLSLDVAPSLQDIQEVALLAAESDFVAFDDDCESSAYYSWLLIHTGNLLRSPRISRAIRLLVRTLRAKPQLSGREATNLISALLTPRVQFYQRR